MGTLGVRNDLSVSVEPVNSLSMTSMVSKQYRIKSAQSHCRIPDGHPMVHIGFEGSRHLMATRLPSAKGRRATAMRVVDLNDDTTQLIREISEHLRRLDLSNLHLVKLNDNFICTLTNLEQIDIGYNELTEDSFPPSFKNMEKLVELCAHHNKLTTIPKVVKRLKNLTRLKLRGNSLVDMDGMDKLKKLQMLVLDDNKIEVIPKDFFLNVKRVELLHCAANLIKEIPGDVRQLRHLRDIDVSNNQLTYLPPELLLLPRLDILIAGGNQISRIPTINVKGRNKRKLSTVDLSDNLLVKFPEHLLFMTDRLDLSQNKIKVIPATLIQKLDWSADRELIIDGNPLSVPPPDVCECGIRAVMQYFQEAKADMKIFQGLKVLVVGGSNQGKTSLIQSIVDQQPRLTDDERSTGTDSYDFRIDLEDDEVLGKCLNLSLWDFCGNVQYIYQHMFFLEQPALVVVVFNLADYEPAKFSSLIGIWMDCILAKSNQMNMLVVGTHKDKVRKSNVRKICKSVHRGIVDYIDEHKKAIEKEIKAIESLPHISPALSEQLKHYISLLKVKFTLYDEVIPVSCTDTNDLDNLVKILETVATNMRVFPDVLKIVPSLWGEVENYVEDRGYAMNCPILTWKEFSDEISNKFGMRHLMEQIALYLHDTGKVLWYSDNPMLKQYVFLRPSWLTDLFKQIFRNDIQDLDYNSEESFKLLNISTLRFDKMKREVVDEGIFDREYLKCMWHGLLGSEFTKPVLEILVILIEKFEMGYPIMKVTKGPDRGSSAMSRSSGRGRERLDSASTIRSVRFDSAGSGHMERVNEHPDVTAAIKPKEDGPPNILKMVVPWMRKTPQPKNFREEYDRCIHRPCLAAVFRFPRFLPPGFFEVLISQTLRVDSGYHVLHHWSLGMYVRHAEKPLRLYLLKVPHEDCSTCIRLELRLEEIIEMEEKDTDLLWSVMLPILQSVEKVLGKYAGARVERYMECPICRSPSFLGEWQTPKELQSMSTKKCDQCEEDVDTSFLIQPKERRRVEELIALKKKKQELERKKKLETMQEEAENAADDRSSNYKS